MAKESDWTESMITKLRELAATGMTSAALGLAVGMSKNAVVGKCRRAGIELLGQAPRFTQVWISDAADDLIRAQWDSSIFALNIAGNVSKLVGSRIGPQAILMRGAALGLLPRTPIRTGRTAGLRIRHLRAGGLVRAKAVAAAPQPKPRPIPAKRKPIAKQSPVAATAAVPIMSLAAPPRPPRPRTVITTGRTMDCQWLGGQRGAWVACGETSEPGRPYCWDHCEQAYQNFGREAA